MKRLSTGYIIDLLGGTAITAKLSDSAWSTVSDWRHMKAIPSFKLVLLANEIEKKTNGQINRKKLFPKTWARIWPELESK